MYIIKNMLCLYIYIYIYIYIYKLHEYKYIHVNTCKYFQNTYLMCVYSYIYIINIHSTHTHVLYKQKLLFWMRYITINHLTALISIRNTNDIRCGFMSVLDIYFVTKFFLHQKLVYLFMKVALEKQSNHSFYSKIFEMSFSNCHSHHRTLLNPIYYYMCWKCHHNFSVFRLFCNVCTPLDIIHRQIKYTF